MITKKSKSMPKIDNGKNQQCKEKHAYLAS